MVASMNMPSAAYSNVRVMLPSNPEVADAAPQTESLKQPDQHNDDNQGIQYRLDTGSHRYVTIDQIQPDADNN